jgi:hypothetical protein
MLAVTPVELSNARQQLQGEVSLWRCEVSFLHQEYRKALVELHRLEAALRQQEQALEAYATALATQEQRLVGEAREGPAEYEGETTEGLPRQAPMGSHEILKHWRQREDHEQIKRQHYAVLAYWSLLLQTVSAPRERGDVPVKPKAPAHFRG